MERVPVIAVTSGEPAGIGPELCARLAKHPCPARCVILSDRTLIEARAQLAGDAPPLVEYRRDRRAEDGVLEILHIPLCAPSRAGHPHAANAAYVLALLDRALHGCIEGEFAAMVTAPVHKGVINEAGIAFSGHTEYLAEKTGTAQVVMMLTGAGLRVALATTHLPLKEVADAITQPRLETVLRILRADLVKIDGQFIRNLSEDRENQVFVRAIAEVARGMGAESVAEFVETAETARLLPALGVNLMQGRHFDLPRADPPALAPVAATDPAPAGTAAADR